MNSNRRFGAVFYLLAIAVIHNLKIEYL